MSNAGQSSLLDAVRCAHCVDYIALRRCRGLCSRCYYDPAIRCLFPVQVVKTGKPRPRCVHCGLKPQSRAFGLCRTCSYTPSIRLLYSTHTTCSQEIRCRGVLPIPTASKPGSDAKVAVLESRYANGEILWHHDDFQEPFVRGAPRPEFYRSRARRH